MLIPWIVIIFIIILLLSVLIYAIDGCGSKHGLTGSVAVAATIFFIGVVFCGMINSFLGGSVKYNGVELSPLYLFVILLIPLIFLLIILYYLRQTTNDLRFTSSSEEIILNKYD